MTSGSSASPVSWPVSARKTSSSVGLATLTETISTPAWRRPIRTSAARSATSSATFIRPDSGVSTGSAPSTRRTTARASVLVGAGGELQLQRRVADRRLQLVRRALGDLAAAVDDGDPVGELVGLVEVLRGQQHRAAVGDEAADRVPHLAAGARVQAGGRLVEEDQRRARDQACREVEPPAHAARELRDRPVGGLLEAELLEQRASRSRARPPGAGPAGGRTATGSPSRSGPRRPTRTGRSRRRAGAPGAARGRRRRRRCARCRRRSAAASRASSASWSCRRRSGRARRRSRPGGPRGRCHPRRGSRRRPSRGRLRGRPRSYSSGWCRSRSTLSAAAVSPGLHGGFACGRLRRRAPHVPAPRGASPGGTAPPVEGACPECGAAELAEYRGALGGRLVGRAQVPALPALGAAASRPRASAPSRRWARSVLGVDVGGTFTDVVAFRDGRIEVTKVPSDRDDPARPGRRGRAAARRRRQRRCSTTPARWG